MASMLYQIIVGAKDKATATLSKVGDKAGYVAKRGAELTAAFTVAGGAIAGFAARQVEVIDGMAKAARAAGVSAESLQELRFAAERSGASAKQLDEGLRRMNRRIGLAADGAGPAAATLERMGIAVKDAGGNVRGTEDILDEFIKKAGDLGSQAEVAAAASALFGDDAGPKLALLLAEGADGISSLREEARKYGIVSNDNALQAEKTQDAITNLKQVFGALGQTITVSVAPVLEKLARFLATAIPVAVTGATVAIRRLRQIMVQALSDITNKARETVDSILAWVPANSDLARSLGETSDKLRSFSANTGDLATVLDTETNDALAELDAKITQISQQTIPPAVQALDAAASTSDDVARAASEASGDLGAMGGALDDAGTSAEGMGDSANDATDDLSDLCHQMDRTAKCGKNLGATIGPEGGLTAFIEEMAERMRTEGIPALEGVGAGAETAAEETKTLVDAIGEMLKTDVDVEAWGEALLNSFSGVEAGARSIGQELAGLERAFNFAGNTNAAAFVRQIQGVFTAIQEGDIGGAGQGIAEIYAGARGLSPSGQLAASVGGRFGGGVVGAILGEIFDDRGEVIPRISVTNNRLFEELDRGDPDGIAARYLTPFSRRSALGVTFQGQQITQALGGANAQQILDSIQNFDQVIADIVRGTSLGNADAIKAALLGPSGDSSTIYEEGFTINDILSDRFNTILTGFDQSVQDLVGTVTDAEQGIRRLTAAIVLVEELETGPLEQYEEALRQANLTLVETFQEQGDELIKLAENYSGSTADLEALAAGTQAFNQAVTQTLLAIDQAKQAVSDITAGTLEGLEFRRIGEEEGAGAQIRFLLDRARQLRAGINDLESPDAVQQQVALINNLVNQASGLLQPGQIGQFIDNVTPLLTSAEDLAQKRLETIREAVIDVATETGNAVKDAIKEPAATMETASATMTNAANVIIDAANRFQAGATTFGNKVDQFPGQVDVVLTGGEVNAAG